MRIALLGLLLASSLFACAADDESTEQEPTTAEQTKSTTDDLREPTAPGAAKQTVGHEPATMPLPPSRADLAAEQGASNTSGE